MKTIVLKKHELEPGWFIVDAKGQTLGRLATKVAATLRGKHKVNFTPHLNCGDIVVVLNTEHIKLTGNKWQGKMYYHHSRYPGGLKEINAEDLHAKKPTEIFRKAVHGMLPKNRLRRDMMKRLKLYAGSEHPHEAQKPTPLK